MAKSSKISKCKKITDMYIQSILGRYLKEKCICIKKTYQFGDDDFWRKNKNMQYFITRSAQLVSGV